ncbi:hypothetical protein SAMN05443663_102523 [Flavobacterium defluvii]|uniref:Uncharacterized protein n=1 Tax=Flavobacterium defluvii TaxID=370979 RepID=A0A1M5IVD2_9FLAO|nr:hypothetical protein SAMN05443663_102523 [Flavobacterium defluvii]
MIVYIRYIKPKKRDLKVSLFFGYLIFMYSTYN